MENAVDETAAIKLTSLGAILKRSKGGKILVVDFRPVANDLDDEHLSPLAGLDRLKELYLDGAPITDAALPTLQQFAKLVTLDLQHTAVTDAGLVHLKSMKQLKLLLLTGSQVTREGVAQLRKSMIGTRIIFL